MWSTVKSWCVISRSVVRLNSARRTTCSSLEDIRKQIFTLCIKSRVRKRVSYGNISYLLCTQWAAVSTCLSLINVPVQRQLIFAPGSRFLVPSNACGWLFTVEYIGCHTQNVFYIIMFHSRSMGCNPQEYVHKMHSVPPSACSTLDALEMNENLPIAMIEK